MALNQELQEAIKEETENMDETERFKGQFGKLIENYMDGMGAEAEIAEIIDEIILSGEAYED